MESELYKFQTLELLSLYVTMSLKQVVINNLPPRQPLRDLVKVVENNLKTMKLERQWFLVTLRDHSRIYHNEWTSNYEPELSRNIIQRNPFSPQLNTRRKDKGLAQYNTLLLILSLKLGLETPWVPEGHTEFQMDTLEKELLALSSPSKPALEVKHLSQANPIFNFLFKYSCKLETINLPFNTKDLFFQTCQKFKNLRYIDFVGSIPDKEFCHALWGISESSEDVLDMALKGNTEFTINLPHLEILRSVLRRIGLFEYVRLRVAMKLPHQGIFPEDNSHLNINPKSTQETGMLVSLGAAALLLQPAMHMVESGGQWDTMDAVHYLLEKEAKRKSGNGLHLELKKLTLMHETKVDTKQLRRLVKACPSIDTLELLEAPLPVTQFMAILEHVPMKTLKHLSIDTFRLSGEGLLRLLMHTPNLEELTLYLVIGELNCIQYVATSELSKKILTELQSGPRLQTLNLVFDDRIEDPANAKAKEMMAFLNCFPTVTTLHLKKTIFIPGAYLVYGCLGGALASMMGLQHVSIMAHNREIEQPELCKRIGDVICMLPELLDDRTFVHLCRLKTLVLDDIYLAPRVDRMIEALRIEGVAVGINYRSPPGRSQDTLPQYLNAEQLRS